MLQTRTDPSEPELRRFGLLLGGMLLLVFGLAVPWYRSRPFPLWPWLAAAILWAPAIARPALLRPVFRSWMKAAGILNGLLTRVVLAFVYYLIVTPIALMLRLRGKDPLARTWDDAAASYRKLPDPNERNDMERPF